MIDSTENRATRRSAARRVRNAAVAGTAAAAMAFGLTAAPSANAISANITWDPAYTAGALAGLINLFSEIAPGTSLAGGLFNSGPPASINATVDTVLPVEYLGFNIQVAANINLSLLLKYIQNNNSSQYASTSVLYNTIANIPAPATCANNSNATACRYALMLGTSEATGNLAEAYRAQIQSVTTGVTPAGYIPFVAAPGSTSAKPTITAEALALLQNPLRPNGGLYSRFPDIANALNFNSDMPAAGKYTSTDGKIVLNASTIDATWAYDPMADFPEVFNLAAIANSLSAFLPLNVITGGLGDVVTTDAAGNSVTVTDIGLNLAGLLKMPVPIIGTLPDSLWGGLGKAYYATIVPGQLPLLAPMRLGTFAVNAALKALNSPYLLGDPFADAIEPALNILVNIAYPDVVTPTDGGTYNRTFTKSGEQIAFNSVEPLTPEEKAAVPGDVWNAFVGGVQAQLAKPFWGVLVPNTGAQSAAVTPAAVKPAAVKAAAATPVIESAPVAAPVEASAPAVQVSAPAAAPAPAIEIPALEAAPARSNTPAAAPSVTGHRGAAGSGNADGPKAAASTGGHRGAA